MGDPIPQGEGTILGENVAAHRKIMGHSTVSCAKMDDPIAMPFWMKTRVGPRNHVLDGGADPLTGKHNFLKFCGVVRAIQIQCSHRRVRCKRDHSIANNVMQQKGSFSMPGKCK